MSNRSTIVVWEDGKLVTSAQVAVDAQSHCLHYGTGFFEGIRSHRRSDGTTAIFRLDDHIARFFRSAELMSMSIDFTRAELARACREVLEANGLGEAYIRPLGLMNDPFDVMAKPSGQLKILVMAAPFAGLADGAPVPQKRATIASFRRSRANTSFHQAKAVGHYSLVIVAVGEVKRKGVEQAIFLDERDRVCEALTDNVFVVRGDRVLTPSADNPILLGITRETVIAALRADGLAVDETDVGLDELLAADEVFTTGTASGIQAVREIDGRPIGAGRPGPVTLRAHDLYRRAATEREVLAR